MFYTLSYKNIDEVISKVDAGSLELAVSYFSNIKQLPKETLLELFTVKELKDEVIKKPTTT